MGKALRRGHHQNWVFTLGYRLMEAKQSVQISLWLIGIKTAQESLSRE
jgi:hypothetical protein